LRENGFFLGRNHGQTRNVCEVFVYRCSITIGYGSVYFELPHVRDLKGKKKANRFGLLFCAMAY